MYHLMNIQKFAMYCYRLMLLNSGVGVGICILLTLVLSSFSQELLKIQGPQADLSGQAVATASRMIHVCKQSFISLWPEIFCVCLQHSCLNDLLISFQASAGTCFFLKFLSILRQTAAYKVVLLTVRDKNLLKLSREFSTSPVYSSSLLPF